MKIVHLTRLLSPHIGGVETHIANLLPYWRNHEITILTLQENPDHNAINISEPRKLGLYLNILKQADVIHVHDVFFWLYPLLPYLIGKRIFTTFHGYERDQGPTLGQIAQHRIAAQLSRGTLAIGAYHDKWYGTHSTVTVSGAVCEDLCTHATVKRDIPLLFLGRLAPQSDFLPTLEAYRQARKQGLETPLTVVGTGPDHQAGQEFANKHSLPVQFLGAQNNGWRWLARAEQALVSRFLSIHEALTLGTPVQALASECIKQDYLRMTPFAKWIKIAHTPDQLAQQLLTAPFLDPAAQSWSRQRTWKRMASLYEALWRV